MSYPGITSDSTHHLYGAGTYNAIFTGSGILSALVASSDDVGLIVIHDSLNIGSDPRPLLTLHLIAGSLFELCRPFPQGLYFSKGISIDITSAAGDPTIHFTTHIETSS